MGLRESRSGGRRYIGTVRSLDAKIDELIAQNIDDRTERVAAVGGWADDYITVYGVRPPARDLDLLADYILREELSDNHPDKMAREEYPIMSEWQRVRRLRSRFLVGVAEIDYGLNVGYRKSYSCDESNTSMRPIRQRLLAFP